MCLLRLKGEFHCSGLLDGLAPSKWAVRGPQCKINMTINIPYKNTNTPFLILLIKNSAAMGFEWFFFFFKNKKSKQQLLFLYSTIRGR